MHSVEFHFEQNLFCGAIGLDDGCCVFLVWQRDEPLDVNSRWCNTKAAQRFESAIHERFGAAYVAIRVGPRARKFRELRNRRQAVNRVIQMNYLEPRRMLPFQFVQLRTVDDGVFVAVRIYKERAARSRDQRGIDDRENGRDTAATGQQQKVFVVNRVRSKMARRRLNFNRVARLYSIANPVGHAALHYPLHRHTRRLVEDRAAGERIASQQMAPLMRDAQSQKLSGFVTKRVGMLGRDFENDRLGVGGFVDHLAHAQRIISHNAQCALVIRNWAPLMNRDSSEIRNSTRFATSFGSQKREVGSAS